MSTKPKCPDCGATAISLTYEAVICIENDGTVIVSPLPYGCLIHWECSNCEAVEHAKDESVLVEILRMEEMENQASDWHLSLGRPELLSGWISHEATP